VIPPEEISQGEEFGEGGGEEKKATIIEKKNSAQF